MIIVACSRHPQYKAKRLPRCKCTACWIMWDLVYKTTVNDPPSRLRITQP